MEDTDEKSDRSPAYNRYAEAHPTVSFVLTDRRKALLDEVKGEKSYGIVVEEIMNDFLGRLEAETERIETHYREVDEERKREFESRQRSADSENKEKRRLLDQKMIELKERYREESERLKSIHERNLSNLKEIVRLVRLKTMEEYGLEYECIQCRKKILVQRDREDGKFVLGCLESRGWGHKNCEREEGVWQHGNPDAELNEKMRHLFSRALEERLKEKAKDICSI